MKSLMLTEADDDFVFKTINSAKSLKGNLNQEDQ